MSVPTPLCSATLENVQQAFDDWRATRGKRTRTPVYLQRRAVALRETYRASQICSALKINDTALKRWAADWPPQNSPMPPPSAGLVELSPEPVPSAVTLCGSPANQRPCVSIDLGDALRLRVEGDFTLEQILCAVRKHQQGAHV